MSDKLIRQFWAEKLKVQVRKDLQVPGFSDWWFDASPDKRAEAVRDMRAYLLEHGSDEPIDARAWNPGYDHGQRSSQEYATFRWSLIQRIQAERLTPKQVAEALWNHRAEHMQGGEVASLEEIARLEAAGTEWAKVETLA